MRRITWVLYAARVSETLPLFPLNTVLVPGLVMPLHIFEPRYRQLVTSLLSIGDEDAREFGIIAVREGRDPLVEGVTALYPVGCATVIRQHELLEDGRFDIVTTGSRRFRLESLDTSRPLLEGRVEFLPDSTGPEDEVLGRRAAQAFRDYRAILSGQVAEDSDDEDEDDGIPDDPTVLSFLITAAMVLPLDERQALLAAPTTTERLTLARTLLRRECGVISALSALPSLEPLGPPPSAN